MRNALDTIDPLPAFPSDGIAFELQDTEPAYVPSERHKRLPSYRAMQERAANEALQRRAIAESRRGAFWHASKQDIMEVIEFCKNKHDPHITEAACRKSVEQPKQAPAEMETEQSVFERWLYLTLPSGDAESVQHQWACSDARAEWLESQQISEQPKADADGWVKWEGGRPAAELDGKCVEARWSRGAHTGPFIVKDAGRANGWTSAGAEMRIVAYRIVD